MAQRKIDFNVLEEYDAKIVEREKQIEAEESMPFPIEETLYLAAWSRVCESMRFSFTPTFQHKTPTKDIMKKELRKNIQGSIGGSQMSGLSDFQDAEKFAAIFEKIDGEIDAMWTGYERVLQRSAVVTKEDNHQCSRKREVEQGIGIISPSNEGVIVDAPETSTTTTVTTLMVANHVEEEEEEEMKEVKEGDGRSSKEGEGEKVEQNKKKDEKSKMRGKSSSDSYGAKLHQSRGTELKNAATFSSLYNYQFKDFPSTTEEQRTKLKMMAQQCKAISKADVMNALRIPAEEEEENSPVIKYLFASGADVIGNEVFKEIVASLAVEPRALSFAPEFASHQAGISSRMVTLIPNLVILILIMAFGSNFSTIAQHQLFHTMREYIGDEYGNYCPKGAGVTSPLGCDWIKKSVLDVRWPTFDVLRFARSEVINMLWTGEDNETAADTIAASTWLVGALSIRHVLDAENKVFSNSKAACDPSNLSTPIFHLKAGYSFGCEHVWQVVIPFRSTRAEALQMTQDLNMSLPHDWYPPFSNTDVTDLPYVASGLIFDFTAYQRNYGLFVYTRILITLPRGGSAIPRMENSPIDPQVHWYVLPITIFQILSFVVVFFTNVSLYLRGVSSFGFEFFRAMFMVALVTTAYVHLRLADVINSERNAEKLSSESFGNNLYQLEFLPGTMDYYVGMFNTGMSCFGFYVLLFCMFLGRFFRDIPGLELVVTVLRRTYIELVSLAAVFMIWVLGFVCVGMFLFSDTLLNFANITTAAFTVTRYFFGDTNYEELYNSKPITGPIYYFVLQLFVLFFALNLLIAVLTAPLTDIKVDTNADNALLEEIELEIFAKNPEATKWKYFQWWFYTRFWLPFLGVLMDARPIGSGFWLKQSVNLSQLYPTGAPPPSLLTRVQCCGKLLEGCDTLQEDLKKWNSPILRHIISKKLIRGNVSLAICLRLIMQESTSVWMRDSRLLSAAFLYRRWINRLQIVMETQELLTGIAKTNTMRLRDKLKLADEQIHRDFSKMSRAEKNAIKLGRIQLVGSSFSRETGQEVLHPLLPPADQQYPEKSGSDSLPEQKESASADINDNDDDEDLTEAQELSVVTAEGGGGAQHLKGSDSPPSSREGMVRQHPAVQENNQTTTHSKYYFADELEKKVNAGPWSLLYALIVLIFFIWFFSAFTSASNATAFLSHSAREGLYNMPMLTRCHDDNCTDSGWNQPWFKSFEDQNHLPELIEWFEGVLNPQLFYPAERHEVYRFEDLTPIVHTVMAAANNYSSPVWWDPRILRVGGVKFRQMRGKPISCVELPQGNVFALSSFYQSHIAKITENPTCYDNLEFTKEPRVAPPIASRPHIPDSAYVYDENCHMKAPDPYIGHYRLYPCEGYYLDVMNSTMLDELLSSEWIDNATRLLSMTVRLWKPDDAAEIDYTLIAEFGDMGYALEHYGIGYARSNIDTLEKTKTVRIAFQVLLVLHLVIIAVLYLRYLFQKYVRKMHADDLAMIKPTVPITLLLAFVTIFIFVYPLTSSQRRADNREVAIGIIASAYTVQLFSSAVVFPAASLVSKNVKVLLDTLDHAAMHCLYVLPFLILFYISFSYSGMIIFGRFVSEFSQIRFSMLQVLLGTFGQWELDDLQEHRPIEAQVFTVFFFCAVIIILANMFLAVVTSASADANNTPPGVLVAENVQFFYGRTTMFGEFLNSFLAATVAWKRFLYQHPKLKQKLPRYFTKKRKRDPCILTPWGRMWFGLECLLPRLRPLQVNRVLKQFYHEALGSTAIAALVPFVITNWLHFRENEVLKFAKDERVNASTANTFVTEVALDALLRLVQDEEHEEEEDAVGSPKKVAFSPRLKEGEGMMVEELPGEIRVGE